MKPARRPAKVTPPDTRQARGARREAEVIARPPPGRKPQRRWSERTVYTPRLSVDPLNAKRKAVLRPFRGNGHGNPGV